MELPNRKITLEIIAPELVFATARSGGPGGQNVNKVNSKVIVKFNIPNSRILSEEEKQFLLLKLASRITGDGVLQLTSQESRSQQDNKDGVLAKLEEVLEKAFIVRKKRKPSKPSKASKEVRMKNKKQHSEKKQRRQSRFD